MRTTILLTILSFLSILQSTAQVFEENMKQEKIVKDLRSSLLSYDLDLIDSARVALSNRTFWFNINMLGSYNGHKRQENPPAAILTNKRATDIYNYNRAPYEYYWPNMTKRNFEDAVFGGNIWSFFCGKLIDIRLMTTIIPSAFTTSYRDQRKGELTEKFRNLWGNYNYYFVIVPDEHETYERDDGYKPKFEEIAHDTLYVPFTKERLEFVMNEYRMADFFAQLKKVRQNKIDRFIEHRNEIYNETVHLFGKKIADIVRKGEVRFGFTTEMCQYAYYGEPYQTKWYVPTPFGDAFVHYYYTRGVKLYFIDDKLIGIQWHDNNPRFK